MSHSSNSSHPTSRGIRWGRIATVGFVLVALTGGAVLLAEPLFGIKLFGGKGKDQPPAGTNAAAVELMKKQLGDWGFDDAAKKTGDAVINQYFEALAYVGDAPGSSNHPDAAFRRRFTGEAPRKERWSADELKAALNNLLARLRGDAAPKSTDAKKPEKLVAAIGEAANYEVWFENWMKSNPLKGSVKGDEFAFSLDRPEPEATRFALRFAKQRPASAGGADWPADLRKTAKTLVADLKRWKVVGLDGDDADMRPYLVFRAYFHFLSQHHFNADELAAHDKDWHTVFVKRFPATPAGQSISIQQDGDLVKALRELSTALGAEGGATSATLIEEIRKAVDYYTWFDRKREKEPPVSEPEKLPRSIVGFVARFKTEAR